VVQYWYLSPVVPVAAMRKESKVWVLIVYNIRQARGRSRNPGMEVYI
jgi:hypothetical protein